MKKIIAFVLLSAFIAGIAFAAGGMGGSKVGTCDWKSWGCMAWDACYNKIPANQYLQYAKGSVEYNTALAGYNACAKDFVTVCMAPCDAKKYYPNLFQ